MQTIKIIDEIGPVCVDPEDGTLLCQQSSTALSQGLDVLLDFSLLRNRWGEQLDFPGKSPREGSGSSLHLAIGSQPLRDAQLQRSQDSCLLWLGPGDPTQGQFPAVCRLQKDVTDLDRPQLPQDDLWRHRPWFG